jgi:hypothetical protein
VQRGLAAQQEIGLRDMVFSSEISLKAYLFRAKGAAFKLITLSSLSGALPPGRGHAEYAATRRR